MNQLATNYIQPVIPPPVEPSQPARSFAFLEEARPASFRDMWVVYNAIESFNQTVRGTVAKVLNEKQANDWLKRLPEDVRKNPKIVLRKRGHPPTVKRPIDPLPLLNRCDFHSLTLIITHNWELFEDLLQDKEWTQKTLITLERFKKILKNGGILSQSEIDLISRRVHEWVMLTH
ncbi:MAG: hypothetical protein SFU83_16535 [Meiothermus sp.]|nr:hypothetical protein [Meiothermus sp.]